jgi:outer membrane protein OmpA-like peptidoglycan-associated protein
VRLLDGGRSCSRRLLSRQLGLVDVAAALLSGQRREKPAPVHRTPATWPVFCEKPALRVTDTRCLLINGLKLACGLRRAWSGSSAGGQIGQSSCSGWWVLRMRRRRRFSAVPGSPFGTGSGPQSVAFSASGSPDDQAQSATTTVTVTAHTKPATVRQTVRFGLDRADLTRAARIALAPLRWLVAYATSTQITGYCAAHETSRHSTLLRLSRQRAQAVASL